MATFLYARTNLLWRLALAFGAFVALGVSVTSVLAGPPAAFTTQQTFPTASNPVLAAVGDFNLDGKPDLAIPNQRANAVGVMLNTTAAHASTPSFAAQQTFATGLNAEWAAVADFNSDGKPDLVVGNVSGGTNNVSVLLNTTAPLASVPSFAPQQGFSAPGISFVTAADVNGDGKPDVIFTIQGANTVHVMLNTTVPNASTATFAAQQTFATGPGTYVAVADVNLDSKPDLVVANFGSNNVSVLLGNGDGTFAPQQTFTTGSSPTFVGVADFNLDGKPDLAVANQTLGTISMLLGNGDGTFAPQQTFPGGSVPQFSAVADVNLDGKPDLVIPYFGSNNIGVLLNTTAPNASTFSFAAQQTFATGSEPVSVAVADFNGDNSPDLAVSNFGSNTVGVLLNTLHNTITATGGTPQSTAIGTAFSAPLAVHVADGLGQPLPGVTVTFTAPTSGASGTFTGGVTTVQATTNVSGNLDTPPIFTANTTLGTYSITASVVGAADATFTLTNDPGPATTLILAGYPSSVVAGTSNAFTVTARDSFGNTATGYTGTVHFTSTDTLATLPADYPFVAGDAGVHTFNASFGAAGTWNLTATDTTTSTITGTQSGIIVTAVGTTTMLTISPSPAAHGSAVTLTATVTPASATNLPTPMGSVTFMDGSTPLGTVSLVNSVATFTTSTLTVGVHHLTATYTPASPGPYTTSTGTGDVTITAAALVSITVTPASTTLKVGQVQQYTATGTYADSSTADLTSAVTWTSDASHIASVDASGKVTGASPGTAHITATQGSVSGQASATVSAPTPIGIAPGAAPGSRPSGASAPSEPAVSPAPAPSGR